MQITADISKVLKNVKSDFTFIYDVFSELRIGFVSFLVILAIENVASFRNYVETLHANIGHNLT